MSARVGNAASWCPSGAPTSLVEVGTSEGNTRPKTCLFGMGITPQIPPQGSPNTQHPRGEYESAPPLSWAHPPITHSPPSWTHLSQTPQSPRPHKTPHFPPAPNLASHSCRAPSPEHGAAPAAPSPTPPAAAASPLRYCQRVASASVCEINSEVERENYVKCGYSGAAGEARLMAKCLFVCLICIFFQRCIFRRVICCLFRPRSVSFLRQ